MDGWFEEDRRDDAAEERERLEASLVKAVSRLAGDADGLVLLRWLVDETGLLRSSYPQDHAQAAWREGRRALGVSIANICIGAGVWADLLRVTEERQTWKKI